MDTGASVDVSHIIPQFRKSKELGLIENIFVASALQSKH
jgi:hypothetical protein